MRIVPSGMFAAGNRPGYSALNSGGGAAPSPKK